MVKRITDPPLRGADCKSAPAALNLIAHIRRSLGYKDAARNQTMINEPSVGSITYSYDSFGRVKTQTDKRGKLTSYTYLADGRTDKIVAPEGTTTYSYNTNKQLTGISSPGGVSRTYGYDTQGRVNNITETISGIAFSTTFTFDTKGRLETKKHPSTIVETFGYNSYGYMETISAGGAVRYTIKGMNAREQLTAATYGNDLNANFGYDAYGYPSLTETGSVQKYSYEFNAATGNLTKRQNVLRGKSESFDYDNLDRLLKATDPQNPQNLAMTYADNGNLSTKSDIDATTAFSYGLNAGPYALTGVSSSTNVIPAYPQTITYNSLQKVSSISEANGSQTINAAFTYNSDNQRAKMTVGVYYGAEIMTRYYVGGSYMKEVQPNTTNEYTYLGGDAYTAPVVVHNARGVVSYYYLLRDHLGNITHQVNTSNAVVAEYSFDAWGRRRNATNWTYTLDANDKALVADRGFTGHEYLSWYKLYNMNGRMYDPAVGRFLSADPFVQDAGNTQHYNRYTYCSNNPLRYTDPSGYTQAEMWTAQMSQQMLADLGSWGTALGYSVNNSNGSNSGDGFVGSGSSTPRLDRYRSTQALDVVGSLLSNPEGGYWSRSSGLVFFSDVSAAIFSGTPGNRFETLRGFHYTDGTAYYLGDNYAIQSTENNIDWKGVTNATVELIGGVAEMAVGGAATYFSAGTATAISGPLMMDGGVRTFANAQRIWMYFNGNAKLANAYPTSLGALAGKGIDMAFGTSVYNVGFGQAIGGWGNDLTSFVVVGGNGTAMTSVVKSPSLSNGLEYGLSLFSYPYSMFNNAPNK